MASGVAGAAGLVLAAQVAYVVLTTPRLPPPQEDVPEDGLLACENDGAAATAARELRLVLIGDSPVEGIGNGTHGEALGGRTAAALSRSTGRPVRYWPYGKSGLTARGVQEQILPRMKRIAGGVDVVVVSCGVNNVLRGHSADTFRREVADLLDAVAICGRGAGGADAKVIVIELLDFSFLPFLPWPLSKVCSWRSRILQRELEAAVLDSRDKGAPMDMAYLPDVPTLLENATCHPLLDHITNKEERDSLTLSDFFAGDDFHPAGHGTIILGEVIAKTYKQLCLPM